ncbi:DUF3810 domain-containing protein [Proteiniclasticum sp.]|uniref:DUF3810 domain-containing protein n=1 Tax=Proteiniclasticum sp. TaxID=2053595 RepID=UPI002896E35C|nr:DUF3810 domain-containing protein [Proteiniclasticum sp.]
MKRIFGRKKGILSEGYLWIIMAGLIYGLGRLSRRNPQLLERLYPASVNRALIRLLSRVTGIIPISLGELFVYFNVLLGIVLLVLLVIKIFTGGFVGLAYKTVTYISLLYVVFMLVFGFNYNRASVRQYLSLERTNYGHEELYALNEMLIERANQLREAVSEDESGVFTIKESHQEIFTMAQEGFERFSAEYPVFSGEYGIAKGIIASEPLNYTGITGIFMPFTGEANVNTKGPDLLFPATVIHEMAHQRGIAYENEANYLAYAVSSYHENPSIRYSGTILALISSMNALYRDSRESYRMLYDTYSEGVKRDLAAYNVFYKAYEGEVHEKATKVNDNYLKSNGQTQGVKSYGEMVDLLLEQFIQKNEAIR